MISISDDLTKVESQLTAFPYLSGTGVGSLAQAAAKPTMVDLIGGPFPLLSVATIVCVRRVKRVAQIQKEMSDLQSQLSDLQRANDQGESESEAESEPSVKRARQG